MPVRSEGDPTALTATGACVARVLEAALMRAEQLLTDSVAIARHLFVEGAHFAKQGFELGLGRMVRLVSSGGADLEHESHG